MGMFFGIFAFGFCSGFGAGLWFVWIVLDSSEIGPKF